MACARDPALGEMLALVRSETLLSNRLAALAHLTSDAALNAMPDFRQRVAVLERMGYLTPGMATVQLKARARNRLIYGMVL